MVQVGLKVMEGPAGSLNHLGPRVGPYSLSSGSGGPFLAPSSQKGHPFFISGLLLALQIPGREVHLGPTHPDSLATLTRLGVLLVDQACGGGKDVGFRV